MCVVYTHLTPCFIYNEKKELIFVAKKYNEIFDEFIDVRYHSNLKWEDTYTIEHKQPILINDFQKLIDEFNPKFKPVQKIGTFLKITMNKNIFNYEQNLAEIRKEIKIKNQIIEKKIKEKEKILLKREYTREQREKNRERSKQWAIDNPDRLKSNNKKYKNKIKLKNSP